jgi:hypothetical protein
MDLTPENKAYIDASDIYTLLYRVRFAPVGDPWFTGETGDYWMKRLAKVRAEDDSAYVQASQDMGWGR